MLAITIFIMMRIAAILASKTVVVTVTVILISRVRVNRKAIPHIAFLRLPSLNDSPPTASEDELPLYIYRYHLTGIDAYGGFFERGLNFRGRVQELLLKQCRHLGFLQSLPNPRGTKGSGFLWDIGCRVKPMVVALSPEH